MATWFERDRLTRTDAARTPLTVAEAIVALVPEWKGIIR